MWRIYVLLIAAFFIFIPWSDSQAESGFISLVEMHIDEPEQLIEKGLAKIGPDEVDWALSECRDGETLLVLSSRSDCLFSVIFPDDWEVTTGDFFNERVVVVKTDQSPIEVLAEMWGFMFRVQAG